MYMNHTVKPKILCAAAVSAASLIAWSLFLSVRSRRRRSSEGKDEDGFKEDLSSKKSVAFVGNSMFYFNDTPRFLARLSGEIISYQDSCLRGGAKLVSLLTDGNGMSVKFATENALRYDGTHDVGSPSVESLLCGDGVDGKRWDFVVMNDHTQCPARVATRLDTIDALRLRYAPLLKSCGAIPVFVLTPAYRVCGIKDSNDLGDHSEFLSRLSWGYQCYADVLAEALPESLRPRIAPVGAAFEYICKHDPELWVRLFHTDDFHPSPWGTYLQCCVLHWTMFGCSPPNHIPLRCDLSGISKHQEVL